MGQRRVWKKWSRSRRTMEINAINDGKVEQGLLIPKEEGGFTNRKLLDALEHKIKAGALTKEAAISQLKERLSKKPGKKETARLEATVSHFSSPDPEPQTNKSKPAGKSKAKNKGDK